MTVARTTDPARGRLDAADCVAIIAGGGMLPVELAQHLREIGQKAIIFRLDGEAAAVNRFAGFPCQTYRLEDFPGLLRLLRRHQARYVVMAGSVERRPRLADLRWNAALFRMLPGLLRALLRGDDSLLRYIVRHVEDGGIEVLGVHDLLPDVVTEAGCLTSRQPSRRDWLDIRAAFEAASAIGALDIGQAAIAIGGRVIALEGIEGTDGLLERTASLRHHGRLAGKKGGVLAKCAKPQQELRIDLPSIGPRTVMDVASAGLAGIALQAGRTLVLERKEVMRLAEEHGIFILGYDAASDSP